jgi:DNA polymerase III epsilon subunit-like protein
VNLPTRILALDLETGGVNSQYDPILQIGAAVMEGDEVVDIYQSRVRPNMERFKISLSALAVQASDISTPDGAAKAIEWLNNLATAPESGDVAREFAEWCVKHDAAGLPLVAHNCSFDAAFLNQWAFQQKRAFKPVPLGAVSICTMQLAKRVLPGGTGYGLDACLLLAGLPTRPGAHDALQDAILCGRVYHFLSKQLTGEFTSNA